MKKVMVILTLIMFAGSLFAGDGAGTSGAAFLKLPVGAKAAALGDAIVAHPFGAESVFWNPGALAFQQGINFNASYQQLIADVNTQFVGFSYGLGDMGTIGLGFFNLGMADMDRTTLTDPAGDGTTFGASSMALTLAYGKKMGMLGVGLGVKYVSEKIDDESATAFTADLGLKADVMENLAIGLAAQNLFGKIGFTDNDDAMFPLPMIVKFGLAFMPMPALCVLAQVDYHADSGIKYSGGLEYVLMDMIALRVGYKGNYDAEAGLTAGIGVKYQFINIDFSYGLVSEEALKNIMKFSLGLHF